MIPENILILDSESRSTYTNNGVTATATNYKVQLTQPKHCVKGVKLLRCTIPNTIYNINATNNRFSFTSGVTNYSITLNDGAYTAATGATELETRLNAILSGFTVTYDSTTMKITVTHATVAFTILSVANNCYTEFGFTTIGATQLSQTGASVVSMARPYYFLLNVEEFGAFCSTADLVKTTFLIPKNVNSNAIIDYEPSEPVTLMFKSQRTISSITVSLTDKSGTLIDLNGSNWSFIIEFLE